MRRLDANFEDVIVIDGVESAPYYTWDVDWPSRRFTLRGWNKHLLAIGLDDAAAYRSLPLLGGEGVWQPQDGGSILRMLWPVLGLFYAVWLGRRMHGGLLRTLVGGVCLLFLLEGALQGFRRSRFDPYVDAGQQPYQMWIDAVAEAGGLAYWSHPEGASTIAPYSVGGVAQVLSDTPRHAGDLVTSQRYTGFAALYADHITLGECRTAVRLLDILMLWREADRSKVIMLEDNRPVSASVAKGRSPAPALNYLLRRRAAMELAAGIRAYLPWVESPKMPADDLSRTL